jgi:hypothetical protein
MKNLFSLVIAVLFTTNLLAQKGKGKGKEKQNDVEITKAVFGKIEKADLEMKQCSFDEKAEAVILFDDGQLDFIAGGGYELKKIRRIKILTEKGLEWANVHLPYLSDRNEEEITGLEAQTYNLDNTGNITISKVEKKLIYEKKINKKYSEKIFTFPEVKVGSIIEYKYKHKNIGLIDWYFQRSIPVSQSRFAIDVPVELVLDVRPFCSREYLSKVDDRSDRTIRTYSMSNIPGLRDEPYIINEDFYRDRLETKIVAYNINGRRENRVLNWLQVIRFLMEDEDFGIQLKKNIPRTADLDEKLKAVKDPYEKMKTIYKYVQDNMQWNEYVGIWAFDGVRAAWKDKKGTVGEINLILTNLLKDADLNAHPVLVSTHSNGVVNASDAGTYGNPGFTQFDRVMALVEIGDKTYVLDATEKDVPVHLFPPRILMTEGLVIEKIETFDWGWHTLWNDKMIAKNTVSIMAVIDSTGNMMTGEATITSEDYARLDRLPIVKKGKDKYIEKYITGANEGMIVNGVEFENQQSDSLPLVQKIKFEQPLNSSGDYKYFSCNMLSGLEKNPFIADNRFSDVFFGNNQKVTLFGTFLLPVGYEVEAPPKNVKMILSDTSITVSRRVSVSGDQLLTRIELDFKKPFYPASQYGDLHEFYKELQNLLNEQFVIRKKNK